MMVDMVNTMVDMVVDMVYIMVNMVNVMVDMIVDMVWWSKWSTLDIIVGMIDIMLNIQVDLWNTFSLQWPAHIVGHLDKILSTEDTKRFPNSP